MFAAMAAVGLVLAAAGCTASRSGGDGDLTGGWPMIGPATPYRPVAGECHETQTPTASMDDRVVACAKLHVAETFHVGAAPDGPIPPAAGSAGARAAYQDCATRAVGYLGGPWRGARIGVRVVWPTRAGWSGGARWFRCDVAQSDLDGVRDASRSSSLAGALKGPSPLRLGCFDPTVDAESVSSMKPLSCTAPHHAEFAGLWTAPDIAYAKQVKDRTRTATGCRSAIAAFADLPDDSDVQYRTGWISVNPTKAEWLQGERRVRCFLWFSDRALTRSLRDAGPSALPVH
jgi:putative regulator of septum formation